MKSSEWEVMPIEGNKESNAVIVGTNTTVPSPDILIRISRIIVVEIWKFSIPIVCILGCANGIRRVFFKLKTTYQDI